MTSKQTGNERRSSLEQSLQNLHIALLGKTGAGKSASGNTIIGDKKAFKEGFSPASGTKICRSAQTEVKEQNITVIDTVGLSDTSVSTKKLQTKIEQIFDCTEDGIDAFLLVIKLGNKYTVEEQNTVKLIQDNFGEKASKHTIALFTHGDQLQEPVEKYLGRYETLRSIVDQCSGGYHVFNNRNEDHDQVTELLRKIEKLKMKNAYKRYAQKDYEETLYRTWYNGVSVLKYSVQVGAAGVTGSAGAAGSVIVSPMIKPDLTKLQMMSIGAAGIAAAAFALIYFYKKKNQESE